MLVDKLQVIEDKFMDLEQRISDPEIIARQQEWQKLTRQHASLTDTVETFRTYKKVLSGLDEAMEVLEDKSLDEDFRAMAQEELKELKEQREELEEKLHILLLPKDPNDDKNIIIEIRGGAVVMKPHYLPVTCSVCIQNMRKRKGGSAISLMLMNRNWVVSKRLYSLLMAIVYILK